MRREQNSEKQIMKKDIKLIAALCLNALIVVFELIALVLSLIDQGLDSFHFYTQDTRRVGFRNAVSAP